MEPGSGYFYIYTGDEKNRELVFDLFTVICEAQGGDVFLDEDKGDMLEVYFDSVFGELQAAADTKAVCDILDEHGLSGICFTADMDFEHDWETFELIRMEKSAEGFPVRSVFYEAEHEEDYFGEDGQFTERAEQWLEKVERARNDAYERLEKSRPVPFVKFCREIEVDRFDLCLLDSDREKISGIVRTYREKMG